jgi:hypothetical protein
VREKNQMTNFQEKNILYKSFYEGTNIPVDIQNVQICLWEGYVEKALIEHCTKFSKNRLLIIEIVKLCFTNNIMKKDMEYMVCLAADKCSEEEFLKYVYALCQFAEEYKYNNVLNT